MVIPLKNKMRLTFVCRSSFKDYVEAYVRADVAAYVVNDAAYVLLRCS